MRGPCVCLLVLLAAQPAFAQLPAVDAGDWLRLAVTARFQGDVRRSDAPMRNAGDETPEDAARRRVGIEGRVGRVFGYQVEYELGAREWRDVYLDYRQFKAARVRAGAFKLPFGLEETTSATSLDFVYRARVSSRLAPGRDRGVSVHGRLLRDAVSYEAGVFRHDGDNARPSRSARVYGGPTMAARVVVRPFQGASTPLAHLQIGGAVSGTTIPLGFSAVRGRTVFGAPYFGSDFYVKGRRMRTGLEARWTPGRARLQAEYIRLTDQRRGQSVEDTDLPPLVAHGWYVGGTYAVLGARKGRYGRLDAAVRYETLIFGSAGDGPPSTSRRADEVLGNTHHATTVGANWRVNRWVKVQLNLIREAIKRPEMGPLPDRSGFWSRAFRLQLTL